MWHFAHISLGTEYDKFENLTKLTGGEHLAGLSQI